jgi:hypothetical protein
LEALEGDHTALHAFEKINTQKETISRLEEINTSKKNLLL